MRRSSDKRTIVRWLVRVVRPRRSLGEEPVITRINGGADSVRGAAPGLGALEYLRSLVAISYPRGKAKNGLVGGSGGPHRGAWLPRGPPFVKRILSKVD